LDGQVLRPICHSSNDHAVSRFGRLDCLANNDGSGSPMVRITEVTGEHFSSVFDTNVRGVMFGMKHAARIMIAQRSGSIITIASAAGLRAGISGHIYTAFKAAVIQLSRSVKSEISSKGVRVNTISPSGIVTGIFAKSAGLEGAKADRISSPPFSPSAARGYGRRHAAVFSPATPPRSPPGRTLPSTAVSLRWGNTVGTRAWSSDPEIARRVKAQSELLG